MIVQPYQGNYDDQEALITANIQTMLTTILTTPRAVISGDLHSTRNTPMQISGIQSRGLGQIIQYDWDMNSNGSIDSVTTVPTLTYSMNQSYNSTITLYVTDEFGNRGKTTAVMTIDEIYLSQPAYSVGEASSAVVTVRRDTPTATSQTVTYSVTPGSATTSDYQAPSGSVTFAPNQRTATITIPIVNDSLIEPAEAFTVTLANGSPYFSYGMATSAQVTIRDNDSVRMQSRDLAVAESAGISGVPVVLDSPRPQAFTVNYTLMSGTANIGSDLTASNGTLTFAPGETRKLIPFILIDDTNQENDEQFNVTLTSANGVAVGTPSTTTVTIQANDTVGLASYSPYHTNEGAKRLDYMVHLNATATQTVTVNYTTVNNEATAPSDFIAKSGTLIFKPGSYVQTITISLTDDMLSEPNESLELRLTTPVNAALGSSFVYPVILDNDTISFPDDVTVAESAGFAYLPIKLKETATHTLTVQYATVNQTAITGQDFVASSGTLQFTPGMIEQLIAIPLINDTTQELSNETFKVQLSNPVNVGIDGATSRTVTISPSDPQIKFTSATQTVAERQTYVVVTATLSMPVNEGVSVVISATNGTAHAWDDYYPISDTLYFAPLATTTVITLPINDDGIGEIPETFNLKLSNPWNGLLGTPTQTTITITSIWQHFLPIIMAEAVQAVGTSSSTQANPYPLPGSQAAPVDLGLDDPITTPVPYPLPTP